MQLMTIYEKPLDGPGNHRLYFIGGGVTTTVSAATATRPMNRH